MSAYGYSGSDTDCSTTPLEPMLPRTKSFFVAYPDRSSEEEEEGKQQQRGHYRTVLRKRQGEKDFSASKIYEDTVNEEHSSFEDQRLYINPQFDVIFMRIGDMVCGDATGDMIRRGSFDKSGFSTCAYFPFDPEKQDLNSSGEDLMRQMLLFPNMRKWSQQRKEWSVLCTRTILPHINESSHPVFATVKRGERLLISLLGSSKWIKVSSADTDEEIHFLLHDGDCLEFSRMDDDSQQEFNIEFLNRYSFHYDMPDGYKCGCRDLTRGKTVVLHFTTN